MPELGKHEHVENMRLVKSYTLYFNEGSREYLSISPEGGIDYRSGSVVLDYVDPGIEKEEGDTFMLAVIDIPFVIEALLEIYNDWSKRVSD